MNEATNQIFVSFSLAPNRLYKLKKSETVLPKIHYSGIKHSHYNSSIFHYVYLIITECS